MLNRRQLLSTGAMLGAGAALSGFISRPAFAAETMRLFWWGTPDRASRTEAVAKLFEAANEGVTINGEVGGNDYWTKLTTMIAGGNAPDIFQLEPGRFADFSRRGTLLPLDDYLGSVIQTDKLKPGVLDLGTADGKVTGMPMSLNAFAMIYNTKAFADTGIAPPDENTTWDEFATICINQTKAMNKPNMWATGNCSRYNFAFESWLTQRGKQLYTKEGKAGFDASDAEEWYTYWSELAKAGGCTTAEVQTLDSLLVDTNPLATGNAVCAIGFSNQLNGYQNVSKDPMEITSLPLKDAESPSGLFYRPGLHWSIPTTASNPELAAQFINFFINDLEAGKALQVERGVPVNTEVTDAVLPTIDEIAKKSVDYVLNIESRVGPYPPPVPLGASEFDTRAFRPTADKVAFGQLTPAEGAEELLSQAERMLKS